MRNLLRLQDLTTNEIEDIINNAQELKQAKTYPTTLNGKIVANLFFEPSTRTQYSFNTAEYKLGCKPINFSVASSSIAKGESFYDTVKTFDSFGVDLIILRHAQDA
jgi:aspartate carbamoyltransferase catalytic subunit